MFLLDSNVVIHLLNQSDQGIIQHFQQYQPNRIALCSIVKAELLYGAHHSQQIESNLTRRWKAMAQELVAENAWVHIAVNNDAEEVVQLRDRLRKKVKLVK